ncbi:hypothetical protein DXG01_011957 [Tephrocybe rancida]|nr:hypothetical protein DXG01_011957 [Tephrocybe rancida]
MNILTGLFAALSLVITLIFSLPALTQLLRPMSRILTASSGAFSLVLSIALLAHIPAWADIWERLWLHDGESWGTSKEKGLSATYFILFGVGIAVDYALNRWLGECPDEKWDHFLANYSANLPNNSDRAGSFRPLPIKSLWGRLFATQAYMDKKDEISPLSPFKDHSRNSITKDPVLFSDDEYDKDFATNPHLVHDLPYDDLLSPSSSPAFLKKARSQTTKFKPHKRARGFQDITRGRKQPVKFGQDLSSDSSGDDSDAPHQKVRPWLKQKASMSSSTPTLVDQPARTLLNARNIDLETVKHKKARTKHASGPSVTPVYSDYEEDIATPSPTPGINEEGTGWRPEFIRRYSSSTGVSGLTSSASGHSSAPMGAVPATPSLIKALDRITAAQRDAFGSISVHSAPSPNQSSSKPETKASSAKVDGLLKVKEVEGEYSDGDPDIEVGRKEQLAPGWDEFWREVKHKAAT